MQTNTCTDTQHTAPHKHHACMQHTHIPIYSHTLNLNALTHAHISMHYHLSTDTYTHRRMCTRVCKPQVHVRVYVQYVQCGRTSCTYTSLATVSTSMTTSFSLSTGPDAASPVHLPPHSRRSILTLSTTNCVRPASMLYMKDL